MGLFRQLNSLYDLFGVSSSSNSRGFSLFFQIIIILNLNLFDVLNFKVTISRDEKCFLVFGTHLFLGSLFYLFFSIMSLRTNFLRFSSLNFTLCLEMGVQLRVSRFFIESMSSPFGQSLIVIIFVSQELFSIKLYFPVIFDGSFDFVQIK